MTSRVNWNGQELLERARLGAQRGVVAGTEMVREEAVRLILQTSKTGRLYRRRGVTHQASAPGEPPASDTGRLVNSIRTEYDMGGFRGMVIASTAYAAALEYGTSRMAARPYMRPALANKRAAVEAVVSDSIVRAIGGG